MKSNQTYLSKLNIKEKNRTENMDNVDKLTLELFTNKSNYRKYLSKNEPETYRKIMEKREQYTKYKADIVERTEYLLSFPDLPISPLVQETFENYVDVLIKEMETNKLEIKDLEREDEEEHEHDEEEDVLFPEIPWATSHKKFPSPILREIDTKEERKTFWNNDTEMGVIYGKTHDGIFNHYPTNTAIRKRFVGRRNSYNT